MDAAKDKVDAAFEFISKIGAPYYAFHDRDIAPEGDSVAASEKNLNDIVALAKERQNATGVKLLWGTANAFTHRRYMNGASTNPSFNVLAYAGSQVKAALDATSAYEKHKRVPCTGGANKGTRLALGGENYVFWGGREGYSYLFNTDMKRELEHMGRFLTVAHEGLKQVRRTGSANERTCNRK